MSSSYLFLCSGGHGVIYIIYNFVMIKVANKVDLGSRMLVELAVPGKSC